ncbi:MAG: Crp/Fnr family transcriptional regulator [Cyclobacteriaceae bacterium]
MSHIEDLQELLSKFDFKSNFLYEGLTDSQKIRVQELFEPISFKKGSKLFYEDGIPTGVFLIESGLAKKSKSIIGEKEQIFYIYAQGDLLGYHALLSDERYQDSCAALVDLTASFMSKDNFLMILEEIPALKMSLIINLSHEFGVLANTISILAQNSQNIRLALFLLVLESRYNRYSPNNDGISIARQDLADLIGATRESLGRTLKEFKEEGLVSIKSKTIHILNHQGLYQMLNT